MTNTHKTVVRTADLGLDWFATEHDDGSITLRNCGKGQRIDLEPESVERLRDIFRQVREKHAA